ncbi:hypothetical protein DFS34DRAFT_636805 [Phlyctochytrium arcticum]|nr:hypothetical protein DFS34DRAFT_636804 [Phlyctochytrium arcticum]KAI9090494.1 hypothetical protein DFS34DRAFT_636805 [Phlyctochytrium arcticum]
MAMSIAALTDQPIALTDESLADKELEEDDFDVHGEENLIDCFLEQFTVDWDALDPSDDEEVDGPQQIVTGSAPASFDQDGVASDLVECFHQNQQRWPTLETAFDDLRDTAHAHGFAVKTKREKNADKAEGERSERTNKEFKKMRYVQCACAGVAKADPTASADTGKVTRTRLKGCEWAATIEKIGGRYAIQITGQHNHPATDDIRIYPMARKGTVEQEAFVESLLRARTSTAKILENLEERFGDSCRLIAKDIQNRRQRQRERERAGLPEMDALMRDMMADGAIFHVKQSEAGNITHLIVIPSS